MDDASSNLNPPPDDILMASMTRSMLTDLVTEVVNSVMETKMGDYEMKSSKDEPLDDVKGKTNAPESLDDLAENEEKEAVTKGWTPPPEGTQPLNVVRLDDLELYLGNVTLAPL